MASLDTPVRVSAVRYDGSICDGPGVRVVLYLQGCLRRCKGCHNPETWDPAGGHGYTVGELAREVMSRSEYQGITISGGEPLLQPDAVLGLIQAFKQADTPYNVTLYTGNPFSSVPIPILDSLDYIKVGDFREELKSSIISYMGSSNQTFIDLNQARRWITEQGGSHNTLEAYMKYLSQTKE